MTPDPTEPEVLASFENEMEAMVIVEALAEHGIRAEAVGGFTAGFKTGAPGLVDVVVEADELAKAKEILAELPAEAAKVDWSTVDTGDDSPVSNDETGDADSGDSDADEDTDL